MAMTGMAVLFLTSPIADLVRHRNGVLRPVLLVLGLVVFLGLFANLVLTRDMDYAGRPRPWRRVVALTAVGAAMPLVGGTAWIPLVGITGAAFAAYLPRRVGTAGVLLAGACSAALAVAAHADGASVLIFACEPLVIGGFAYASGRRVELIQQLRATRRELARTAVAEERLRISRDLHDLLGHTLSVIAVKAELARRMVPVDPARAEREIGEVEAAARRALHEVGEAVTGYRNPSLAGELASARRALTASGIDCAVDAPTDWVLPPEVDTLLAWAAREGATNVVRHSHASRCTFRLSIDASTAALEVVDDGRGLAGTGGGDPGGTGSGTVRSAGRTGGHGLAGLAERAGRLGGRLAADAPGGRGFRLRVSVPVGTR
jgi:two-component system sensor histidine kinase DesK